MLVFSSTATALTRYVERPGSLMLKDDSSISSGSACRCRRGNWHMMCSVNGIHNKSADIARTLGKYIVVKKSSESWAHVPSFNLSLPFLRPFSKISA
jgi:hypothetical protein